MIKISMPVKNQYQYGCYVMAILGVIMIVYDTMPAVSAYRIKKQALTYSLSRLHELNQQKDNKPVSDAGINSLPAKKQQSLALSIAGIAHKAVARLEQVGNVPPESSLFREQVHCRLSGSYQQLVQVMRISVSQEYGLCLLDFSLTLQKSGNLLLVMDVAQPDSENMYKQFIEVSETQTNINLSSPFCPGTLTGRYTKNMKNLQKVSLTEIHLAGFLQQGQAVVAWLRLPDETLAEVSVGDMIGIEHAQVTGIDTETLTAVNRAGKKWHIK